MTIAGYVTEDADSLHRKKTKRWQNVNPHFKYNITVVIYRTHLKCNIDFSLCRKNVEKCLFLSKVIEKINIYICLLR